MTTEKDPFVVEAMTVAEANKIDTDKYRLSEALSKHHTGFIFLRRGGR